MYTVQFGDYELDMFPGAYMVGNEELEITIPGDNLSLDYVESIVSDRNNLQSIIISDARPMVVAKFEKIYTEFDRLEKNPHYMTQKYDGDGNLDEKYGDAIIIRLSKPTISSKLSQIRATVEYMAIMTDVDIDEEI